MSAKRRGRAPRASPPQPAPAPPERPTRSEEAPDADEPEGDMAEGMLVDQGDGMRVVRRSACRSGRDDVDTHELPDEPPDGWGEG